MGSEMEGASRVWLRVVVTAAVVAAVFIAEASLATSTANMPWEDPLESIQSSLTGPVALVVAVLGVVVCGAMLIFGGDMQEFTRRMIYVVLAISVLVSASSLITLLFPSATGAVV